MKNTLNHKKNAYLLLALLSLLQLAFVHAYLPIGEWFSHNAIYTDDFSFHYGHVLEKTAYLKKHGKMWGYNPSIRAGSIANATTTIDNNGWVLFSFLLFFLPVAVSFKLYCILGIAMVPLLCYRAARNFDFSQGESLIASLIGALLMHVTVMVNFIHWGTVSFIFASYISILAVSCFYRFCLQGRLTYLITSTILVTATVWIHAFAIVILSVPLICCYIISFPRMGWLHHLSILISLLFIVVANMPWLYPFLLFLGDIVKDNVSFFYAATSPLEPLKTYVLRNNLFNSYMNMIFRKEEWVDILLLLSALFGLYYWLKSKERLKAIIFLISCAFFLILSYYGAFFKPTNITPMRFLITLTVFLVFPSTAGLQYVYRFLLADKSLKVKTVFSLVTGYMVIALVAPAYYHIFYKKDFRLVYNVPQQFKQLVSWINHNTSNEGRILVENSDFESEHLYYGTHLPFLLPLWTKRTYIGVYSSYATAQDSFTSFCTGLLFRKPIGQYTPEELKSYFDLYNIRWIIYWSKESKEIFSSDYKSYTPLSHIDKFYICRVEREPTFFLKGSGSVSVGPNEIKLTQVKAPEGEVIISYHWMKYLKTEPHRPLEKAMLLEDPVGFIKIKDPPPSLLIYNGY